MKKELFFMLFFAGMSISALSQIQYVKESSTGDGDGSSWTNATSDLQAAIDAAGTTEVWVAEGTYVPTGAGFKMKNNVAIYGGFPTSGAPTFLDRDYASHPTILSGNDTSRVINNDFNVLDPMNQTAVLDGFTISNGYVGGGPVSGNSGAGFFNTFASPSLQNLIIKDNAADFAGAGMANIFSNPNMTNVLIINNIAGVYGGGIGNKDSDPVLTNVVIANNESAGVAGGMYNDASSPFIRNSIIFGNMALSSPGMHGTSADPVISYSLVQEQTGGTDGNLNGLSDPLFVDPGSGDYRLQNNSVLIDAGSDSYFLPSENPDLSGITNDLAGNGRIQGSAIDMGVYEKIPIVPDVNDIVYVRENADGNGSNWTNATGDLQAAIDANGVSSVWVAAGTYFASEQEGGFHMKNDVEIYGGFPPTGNPSMGNRNWTVFTSTLSPRGSSSVVRNDFNAGSNLQNSAKLDGFTITGGDGSEGGGIFNQYASPVLTNLIITGNTSLLLGGGVYNAYASPVMTNVIISDNVASPFFGNGGGMYNAQSSPVLTNVVISENSADHGGGIYNNNSTPNLRNSIVYGNTATTSNPGIGGAASLVTVNYCLVEGLDGSSGTGNIDGLLDPLFTNPLLGNFIPQENSPVRNTGSNSFYDASETPDISNITQDLAGNARIQGGTVDMGPFEFIEGNNYIYLSDIIGWQANPGDPNGTATFMDNVQILGGTANFTQDIELNNLEIVENATLEVEQVLTANGNITNAGKIVFVSDGANLGQLGELAPGSNITGSGDVTVQRFVPAHRAFRFIASPVESTENIHANWQEGAVSYTDDPNPGFGVHITGTLLANDQQNGFDGTPSGNPSLFLFDNDTQMWGPIPNTDATMIEVGKAYRLFFRGDRSVDVTDNETPETNTILRSTGALFTGDFTQNLASSENGYSFVGNPYQAILDMNSVLANSSNLNPNFYYIWDQNLSTRGAYATVFLPTGTNAVGSDADQFAQPGQAFFVQTMETGAASISISETDKAVFEDPTDVFKATTSNAAMLQLQLYQEQHFVNSGPVTDGLLVQFSEDGNNAVLHNDARKLGNLDENLSLVNDEIYLSMENRALPEDSEVLPLFINQYRNADYVFKAEVENFSGNVTAFLHDAYLGTDTELPNGIMTIDFQVDEAVPGSISPERFSIVFDVDALGVEENSPHVFSIYPNPVQQEYFYVSAPEMTGTEIAISMYDILGKQVYTTTETMDADGKVAIDAAAFNAGIYMVEVTQEGKTITKKVIIE